MYCLLRCLMFAPNERDLHRLCLFPNRNKICLNQATRGVKQGCPLSALLFILVVEILALRIKLNKEIKGHHLKQGKHEREIKLSQYADDINVFLYDEAQIIPLIETITQFGALAGPKLNLNKSIGMYLTECKNANNTINGIGFTDEPIRCLGIYVGTNQAKCMDLNWLQNIEKLEKELEKWKTRRLRTLGK